MHWELSMSFGLTVIIIIKIIGDEIALVITDAKECQWDIKEHILYLFIDLF